MAEGVSGRRVGLADVVERGDLRRRLDGRSPRFVPSTLDRELLRVADAAVTARVPTGLVLPFAGPEVPVVLAAAALISAFATLGTPEARIAVACKRLALRTFYQRLYIRDQRLADFFRQELLLPDGRFNTIGEQPPELAHYGGALVVSPQLSRFTQTQRNLHGVVVEGGTGEESEFRDLLRSRSGQLPIIYLTANPFDILLDDLRREGAVYAWTPENLADLVSDVTQDAICATAAAVGWTRDLIYEVIGPDAENPMDSALMRLWDDAVELRRQPEWATVGAVDWLWAAYVTISQLAIPVEYYDRHARAAWRTLRLRDCVARAESFAAHTRQGSLRDLWLILADDLGEAVRACAAGPKAGALAKWVDQRCSGQEPGLVVLRNRAAATGMSEYLDEQAPVAVDWRKTVAIATFADLVSGRVSPCPTAMLYTGPVPSRLAGLLPAPGTAKLTVLSHGPWETGRIVRQIRGARKRLVELATGAEHAEAQRRLFGQVLPAQRDSVEPTIIHGAACAPRVPPTAAEAAWQPFDVSVIPRAFQREDYGEDPEAPSGTGVVECLYVSFGDSVAFLDPGLRVSRIRDGAEREVDAKSLRPGDEVILVEGGVRTSLFKLIVEKLEHLPEFAAIMLLVREWQERLTRAFVASGMTYHQVLDGMSRLGTTVGTDVAVANWIRQRVEGPRDPHDLRRIGQVLRDPVIERDWEPMARALQTVRVHRRRVGRMLVSALNRTSLTEAGEDAYFDRRLGIHVSDLVAALSAHRVVSVSQAVVSVPADRANILVDPVHAAQLLGQDSREAP